MGVHKQLPDLWYVSGGAASGGVLVRKGQETASDPEAERLGTGALVKEVEYVSGGSRLHYELVSGDGPQSGWVSTKIKNNELLVKGSFWKVTGGGKAGGVLVREGKETSSPEAPDRLSTGSLIKEVTLVGERLQYKKLTGSGPATGWISTKFKENQLVVRMSGTSTESPTKKTSQPAQGPSTSTPDNGSSTTPSASLDIRMVNEEKGFSYEGLPGWVPRAAAVARGLREGAPYLPTQEVPLARLAALKPLPPFKKFPPKKVKALLAGSAEKLPGDHFGLPLPRTAEQLNSDEFGPAWLTKAFHAAGTLPSGNSVVKILLCEELPIKGFDTAGGAAMKLFLTVEYAKPDPSLSSELLMKYTYDPEREIAGVTQYGADDGHEVEVALRLLHLFPFRAPQTYFADICRDNTVFVIIMEKIPYAKRGTESQCKPYDVLPGCGKYQDFLLPRPEEFYCALFRSMGQLAAWDQLGRFDSFYGPLAKFTEEQYLPTIQGRPPLPKATMVGNRQIIDGLIEKGVEFFTKYAKNLTPAAVQEEKLVQKMKSELVEMSPWFNDMSVKYQNNSSDYISVTHVNLQADNAWFWRDEYGNLDCGVLDWGGAQRVPFCVRFLGCLSGADPDCMIAHEAKVLKSFVDEYARCGGPTLDLEEVLMRYHLAYITFVYDSASWLDKQVFRETPKEEFLKFTGIQDENFQNKFYTRCGSMTVLYAYWQYIARGDFYKSVFDKWSSAAGKPYLSKYE